MSKGNGKNAMVVSVDTSKPLANRANLEMVAQRLGLKVITTRAKDDLAILGKVLEESGAVHAGRGVYFLAADHIVRLLSSVAQMRENLETNNPNTPTEEKMMWAQLQLKIIDSAKDLGQNMIKSESILRELPRPIQNNASFLPGSIVGPVKIELHKPPQETIDVESEATGG